MDEAVRTVRWDGGWVTLVGRRVEGEPTSDAWHAIARGRRTARRLGRPHLIDLPDETVVERVSELEDAPQQAPWSASLTDPVAPERSPGAGERAERARRRLAELREGRPSSLEHVDDAAVAARDAQREAAVARARSGEVLERAALAHEAAADVHERLARLGSDPGRHRQRAQDHRRAAEEDWRRSREVLERRPGVAREQATQ
ncbi:hypothetical protein OMK64_14595 [Cellulomonas fimi]|uniref:hypothetical protein n=1 Tax=Cellulomonas fimi TaxID=1708 RepID=UPI00234C86E4|nr:hypothetical protein [Cellulomonas fimi]MDC7122761.1 hypothetical protein [Cellulomonas fimi]